MGTEGNYVLAMYDVRGKQNFIFNTNKMQEIVGASLIIRDCFKDYLYPAAYAYKHDISFEEAERRCNDAPVIYDYLTSGSDSPKVEGITEDVVDNSADNQEQINPEILELESKVMEAEAKLNSAGKSDEKKYKKELNKAKEKLKRAREKMEKSAKAELVVDNAAGEGAPINGFIPDEFIERVERGGYLGEVIYNGGGNFFVLYKNAEVCKGINGIFSAELLKRIGSLNVLCSFVEINNMEDFKSDENRLRKVHRVNESQETLSVPYNGVQISKVDRNTYRPLVRSITEIEGRKKYHENDTLRYGSRGQLTKESFAKLKKYFEVEKTEGEEFGEKILDNLVEDKGTNSLLAVIFIDGNNMGDKVRKCREDVGNDYSSQINALRNFSASIQKDYITDRKAAIDARLKEKYKNENRDLRRFVVFSGDEINFVCKAGDAWDVVKAYFEGTDNKACSCAGIAVFHSHAPYAEAYRIAEECCESGKQIMKERKETATCYVDFENCQGGMGRGLENIRESDIGDLISKPWQVSTSEEGKVSFKDINGKDVDEVITSLNALGSRTNVKVLAGRAKESLPAFDMEMSRIYAHQSKEKKEMIKDVFSNNNDEARRNLIFDIVSVYDIWFRPKDSEETENEQK